MEAEARQNLKTAAVPAALFFLANALFIVKYGLRFSPWAWLLPVPYAFGVAGILFFGQRRIPSAGPRLFLLLAALGIAFHAALMAAVPASGLNVDRWSAVSAFCDRLLSGDYPYAARTHLGQVVSGFPGLFLILLPFHLTGLPGLFPLFALALFTVVLYRQPVSFAMKNALLLLTLFSPALLWESAARSELFGNMVLLFLFALSVQKLGAGSSRGFVFFAGALAGALLSTRGILLVPLLIFFAAPLRSFDVRQRLLFLTGTGLAVLLIFVPFIVWDLKGFLANNPFAKQSSYIPAPLLIAVLLIALGFGVRSRTFGERAYWSGILLWGIVVTVFLLRMGEEGINGAFFNSLFDLSYFQFAMPFLICSMTGRISSVPVESRS